MRRQVATTLASLGLLLIPATASPAPALEAVSFPAAQSFYAPDAGDAAMSPASGALSVENILHLESVLPGWTIQVSNRRATTLTAAGSTVGGSLVKQTLMPRLALALGLTAEQWEPTDRRTAGPVSHEFYRQRHEGLPLFGSRLQISYRDERPVLFCANLQPAIELATLAPTLTRQQAQAESGVLAASGNVWYESELMILPRRISGCENDRLIWRFICETREPIGSWRLLVDAHTGELIERTALRMNLHRVGFSGEVTGEIPYPTPYGENVLFEYPDAQCRAVPTGGDETVAVYTDETGGFTFAGIVAVDSLTTRLAGRYIEIHEGTLTGATPELTVTAPTSPIDLIWDQTSASAAARGAYIFSNLAHQRLKTVDPAFNWLDTPVPVLINSISGTCNAFSHLIPAAPYLEFQVGNGLCENVGSIADVVYHEYTHLATMYAYLPDWAPEMFAEAYADYFAASLANSSLIGRDLFGSGTMVRNLDNNRTWPVDPTCQQSPHCSGLVLSGALWDIRAALLEESDEAELAIALADSLFHFARAAKPLDFQAVLLQMLLVDDDDGDLTNGTPHLDTIIGGFTNHNIYDSELNASHRPLADTEAIDVDREGVLTISSILPPPAGGVRLMYRFGDNRYTEVTLMVEAGQYPFQLPGAPDGTVVDYYFRMRDAGGRETTLPENAPQELFSYYCGSDDTAPQIDHQPPDYAVTVSDRLWLTAELIDNGGEIGAATATATITFADSSRAVNVPMTRKAGAPDTDGIIYEGAIETGTLTPDGSLTYQLSVSDGSPHGNTAYLPPTGEFSIPILPGQMWDFEAEPDQYDFAGDWEWGTPLDSPGAVSGNGLIGTALNRNYSLDQTVSLISPAVDLTGWQHCLIEFDCWFDLATDGDGVQVSGSVDDGLSWQALLPVGGYPDRIPIDADGDGTTDYLTGAFTGVSEGWQRYRFAADHLIDQSLRLRWELVSTNSRSGPGWYMDDLRIVDRHALSAPINLVASKGGDGRVLLDWSPPPGVGPLTPEWQGYQIYRTTVPGLYSDTPLFDYPLFDSRWLDLDQLTNGERYYYRVKALYTAGASTPSNEAQGYPYRAQMESVTDHSVDLLDRMAADTELQFSNGGTGDLLLDFFLADPGTEWEAIVPQHSTSNTAESQFTLLLTDGVDATAPDISALSCRVTNGYLILHIALHDTLPDPRTCFNLDVMIDTDLSHRTGIPSGYLGADFIARIGAIPFQSTQKLSYLLNDRQEWITELYSTIIQEGLDYIEVAIPLRNLGNPAQVGLALRTSYPAATPGGSKDQTRIPDELPDPRQNSWIQLTETDGYATSETPYTLGLAIDLSGLVDDDYQAQLFVLSNDSTQPLICIDLTARLRNVIPEGIVDWTASSQPEGLYLRWRSDLAAAGKGDDRPQSRSQSLSGFRLKRWSGDLSDEGSAPYLTDRLITAAADSSFSYFDRGIQNGERYYYRLIGVDSSGVYIAFAPPLHPLYDPIISGELRLSAPWPNPFHQATTLRVQAPESALWDAFIVDATGRVVRWLARSGEGEGGIHPLSWDGCLEDGTPAPSSVYYSVVRSGSRQISRSMVLIR